MADDERARSTIEIAHALERLIGIRRADPGRDDRLMALGSTLPATRQSAACTQGSPLLGLASPAVREPLQRMLELDGAADGAMLAAQARAVSHPDRVLANAAAHQAFARGPIRAVCAGEPVAGPLGVRRLSRRQLQRVFREAAAELGNLLWCLDALVEEAGGAPARWARAVTPFAFRPGDLPVALERGVDVAIAPTGWSLTQRSRTVHLDG